MIARATNQRIVVTGGPGSGKSTLIERMSSMGHATEPESGRAVIHRQQAEGGNGLPWADRALFAELMAASDIDAHRRHDTTLAPVFFDRGLVDVVGYLTLCALPVPDWLGQAASQHRYHETAFIAPFWPEIFTQDAERKQDADEARRTFDVMAAVYPTYGYNLIELPKASPDRRLAFVLEQISR